MKLRTFSRSMRSPGAASLGVLISGAILSTAALAQGTSSAPASTRDSTGGEGNTAQCANMSGPARHSCEARMRADGQPTGVNSNSTTGADASIPGATPTQPGSQTLQKNSATKTDRSESGADANRRSSSASSDAAPASAGARSERTRVSQRDQNAAPTTPSSTNNKGDNTKNNPLISTDAAPTRTATELGLDPDETDADSSNRGSDNSRPRPSDDTQSTSGSTSQSTSDSAQQDRARSRPNENSDTTNSPRSR